MFDKKHIIITGTRGSGKTTLINKLRDKYSFINSAPGLITWCEPGKAVYMREVGSEEFVMIGKYDQSSPQKRMIPVSDGFNGYGVSVLEKLIKGDSEWAMIDEIGFLEKSCQLYLVKLNELFETKRVMAVVRKQDIEHINNLIRREDVFVIDLDITACKDAIWED